VLALLLGARVRRCPLPPQLFLAALMMTTGSINTITTKYVLAF